MTFYQQLPDADAVSQVIDADSLKAWDFVWALCVVLLAFLLARIVRRALRPILGKLPNLSNEGALIISRSSGWASSMRWASSTSRWARH